ncbi:helix-turn-helix domain-containing protein [Aliiglaciecola sp. 2_MG-2023]|uniref:helix-turn-helix transcriptional regulator n=1 Tax=unclassified Aliiglaciecola TaxID=2593648 RepID=UPI0026E1AF98|nr:MULTISPECIES: helix-turn-helix domain-containing protein [unclassified Aliiglaciecola]MDO6711171.1 helix-turn-helix domain-containing protein [Aliiglaciecola sp. 2_MG-2023]MDO6752085.1 helix-turn-helix domain-containing protein [Aliiglaciecola sp. 1_MG-2023]
MKPQDDRFINANQLGEMLGVSKVTIWRWRKGSQLPLPFRFNGQSVRWRRSEIESWLEEQRVDREA